MSIIIRNTNLWHTIQNFQQTVLRYTIDLKSSKRTFRISMREKFLAQNWIYGRIFALSYHMSAVRREKFRKREALSRHRRVMSESWYFQPYTRNQKFAGESARFPYHALPSMSSCIRKSGWIFRSEDIRYIFKLISDILET